MANASESQSQGVVQGPRGARSVSSVAGHVLPLAVTGALLMLAFPQPGWGWLAHVALAPAAVVAIRAARARRLAWCAMVVFGAWWIVMLRWLVPVTVPGWLALSLFMAVFWVAALLALRWLDRRYRMPMVLALPMVWVSLELVRGYVPAGGFAWFMLGHTQGSYAPEHGVGRLVQVADVLGVHGVSFLVAMTNGLIVDALTRPLVGRASIGETRLSRTLTFGVVGWLAAMIGAWGYGQYRVGQFDAMTTAGPRLAVVQTNVPQDNKVNPTAEQREAMWRDMVAMTREVAQPQDGAKPTMIVWPETMVPGALNEQGRAYTAARLGASYHEAIQALARELEVALLVGSHVYEDFQRVTVEPGRELVLPGGNYNSVFLYHEDGEQAAAAYSKVHLVPFGEYIPWVDAVPGLKDAFIRYMTPFGFDYTVDAGEAFVVMAVGGAKTEAPGDGRNDALRFATPVCFEDAVARVCRAMVYGEDGRKRAQALVNLTNDGWFAGPAMRAQHVQIAAFRSIENRVPTARSVNTGMSGFIDSRGQVGPVVETDGRRANVTGVAHAELRLDERVTVFGRIGEMPAGLVGLVTAGLILGGWWRRDKIGRES